VETVLLYPTTNGILFSLQKVACYVCGASNGQVLFLWELVRHGSRTIWLCFFRYSYCVTHLLLHLSIPFPHGRSPSAKCEVSTTLPLPKKARHEEAEGEVRRGGRVGVNAKMMRANVTTPYLGYTGIHQIHILSIFVFMIFLAQQLKSAVKRPTQHGSWEGRCKCTV